MPSLIWKDIVAGRRLLAVILPLGILQVATFALAGPLFLPAALAFTGLLAFGPIAMEELQGTERLWASLPVTRGQIVAARYLTALIGILAGLGSSWAAGRAIVLLPVTSEGDPASVANHVTVALMAAILLLAAAVYLPLHFKYGAGRGVVIYLGASVGFLLLLSVAGQLVLLAKGHSGPLLDPEAWRTAGPELREKLAAWLEPRIPAILGMLVGLAAAAFVLSALVSRKIYELRDL